jgi:hypothetical protein
MVINTHTHNDHTGGNPELPRTIEYIAHENTRTNMARMDLFKGNNAALLPKRTFKDKMSLLAGKDRIDLYYFGAGHTNGDAIIVFPALRVAALGDLFARKWAPLVDAGNGGSATAFPDTLANAVAGIKDVDTVITGHSTTPIGRSGTFTAFNPAAKWSDLQEYAGFTREFVSAARAALAAGKTVDEAVSGLKLLDKYRSYDMTNAKADVQHVYEESRRAQSHPHALPHPPRRGLAEGRAPYQGLGQAWSGVWEVRPAPRHRVGFQRRGIHCRLVKQSSPDLRPGRQLHRSVRGRLTVELESEPWRQARYL